MFVRKNKQLEDVTLGSGNCDGQFSQFSLQSVFNRSIDNDTNAAVKITVVQLTSYFTETMT